MVRVFYSILILEKGGKSSQKSINDRLFGKCVSTEVASANTNTSIHININSSLYLLING